MKFAGIVALLVLASLPVRVTGQSNVVVMPRGPLTFEDARQAAVMDFVPTDRALLWLPGDSLLVGHFEAYGTGFAFFINCMGSGFYKVPVGGGKAVQVGDPFCSFHGNVTATPDGSSVLFFGEPAYARRGVGVVRSRDAALLRFTLASSSVDTVRAGCGSGIKDAALSRTGRLAWTGPCRDSADIARDPSCRSSAGSPARSCSTEDHAGVYVAPVGGGEARRTPGTEDGDAHEPSWSPDGASIAYSIGDNPLPGRWEVSGSQPGRLMVADASGARTLGVAGESPSWSPDGRTIAYYGDDRDDANARYGGPRIYLIGSDGTTPRRIFMNDEVRTYQEYMGPIPMDVRNGKAFGTMVWSPDGRWLVFSRQYRDGASLWRVEVSTGLVERVTATG